MSGVQNLGFEGVESSSDDAKNGLHKRIKSGGEENFFITPVDPTADELENEEVKDKKMNKIVGISMIVLTHSIIAAYVGYVTYLYISTRDTCTQDCVLRFCSSYGMLLFVVGIVYVGLFYFKVLKPYLGKFIVKLIFDPIGSVINRIYSTMLSKVILVLIVFGALVGYVVYETRDDFMRLRALLGIAIFIGLGFLVSANRWKIFLRPVICGFLLQFCIGLLFIRWPVGRSIFECFGEKVAAFLAFGRVGAAFVYGEFLINELAVFAFSALSTIYFFGLCVAVLYYLGAMQWVLMKLGWVLQSALGTTVCESVNAAGNIFLGQTESPLVIKPYIKILTHSEIHAVMVSGLSTVAGSVLAAYISFGARPEHLITASVMAAPASLFFAKLVYPEVEESKTSSDNIQLEKSTDTSVLDAASNGSASAIMLILNIIANLVAFVAFIAFADGILMWLTYLLGFDNVGIQFLLGKLFMPVSWLIGVDWEDCEAVGNVIGTKTIINEFVAFRLLGDYKEEGTISARSAAIATFAICSFANPSSIGIMIGGLSALAPERRPAITKVAFRAFFSACLVTLVTASIAGLLLTDDMLN